MFKKLRKEIEKNRNSKNIFWRISVKLKDFVWRFTHPKILIRPTIEWNRCWNNYNWEKNGDEWDEQAVFCNQPYHKWKNSIVENFIHKNINRESNVLEIGPGHGRWTEFILKKAKKLILVDLNPKCIEFCKNKFSKFNNIGYYVNDSKTLNFIEDNSIDFIWSYDSFVHMEKKVISNYFKEFSRVLKPKGKAIVHHPGEKGLRFIILLRKLGKIGGIIYNILCLKKTNIRGEVSGISKKMIKKMALKNNLIIEYQTDSWGKNKEYNCKLCKDCISELTRQ